MEDEYGKPCIALIHRLKPNKNNSFAIDDFYVTPGGGIENGEDIMQAIEREIYEEMGILVKAHRIIYIQETNENIHYYVFCEYMSGIFGTGTGPEFTDPERIIKSGQYIPTLVPIESISTINLVPVELKNALVSDCNSLVSEKGMIAARKI